MSRPPIIIIGAARSGTKLLRDLLAESPDASAVPFDVNYVWRTGNATAPHDALTPAELTPAGRQRIRTTLPRLAGLQPGDDRAMIEKTVSNTLRVPFVHAVYPEARFVHLVRDGRAVAESALRTWQAPAEWGRLFTKLRRLPLSNTSYLLWFGFNQLRGRLSGKGGGHVWGPRYPGFRDDAGLAPLAFCARQWSHCVRAATAGLAEVPAAQVHRIRFEDLVRDPEPLLDLARRLDLGGVDAIAAAYEARVRGQEADKWRRALTPEEQAELTTMLAPDLAAQGYEAER